MAINWQNISTAKKRDESGNIARYLGYFPNYNGGRVDVIWWMDANKPYWCASAIELVQGIRHMRLNQPTHWMPLPDPPTASSS